MKQKKIKTYLLNVCKVLFTALFLYMLINVIDVSEIKRLLISLNVKTVVICLAIYVLIYFGRSRRFVILLRETHELKDMMPILFVHGCYNRVLPFRLGETVFPYLMKKRNQVDIGESATALVIVRVLDLVSTLVIFIAAYVSSILQYQIIVLIGIVLVLSVLVVAIMRVCSQFIVYVYGRSTKLQGNQLVSKIINVMNGSVCTSKLLVLMMLSIINWALLFLLFYTVSNALGFEFTPSDIILAGSFSNLSSILPISGVGNFGTMELGWSSILIMRGYTYEQAMLHGFLLNTATFLCVAVLGGVGLLYLKIEKTMKRGKNNGVG
ncbi:lysylphosphatidylglycerol synthase transmembrane domain-containing protein [Intestinimonas butyriciproducens]|uniref:lysylphosphatidylglycerol synthase transmembrane domain-containing protein n=1 Tax=Intestinimonas butyriciproducens TaxID=1297617 RepID=UPI001959D871|nr:lysylphosphatidylglycerol synthase transmembrane domain-containing protein [Intestinimonas butyriciproducens]MBM6974888.1 flippase-like domain-containing protein [Intestinimonas butyriciproducens]